MNAITPSTSAISTAPLAHAGEIAAVSSNMAGTDQSAAGLGQAVGTILQAGGNSAMSTPDPLSAFAGADPFHDMRLITAPGSTSLTGAGGTEIGTLLGTNSGNTFSSAYPSSLSQFVGAMAGFASEFESVLYNPASDQQTEPAQIQIAVGALLD